MTNPNPEAHKCVEISRDLLSFLREITERGNYNERNPGAGKAIASAILVLVEAAQEFRGNPVPERSHRIEIEEEDSTVLRDIEYRTEEIRHMVSKGSYLTHEKFSTLQDLRDTLEDIHVFLLANEPSVSGTTTTTDK